MAELYSWVLTHNGHSAKAFTRDQVPSQEDAINILKTAPDFIMLPLTLSSGLSLRLAELAHLSNCSSRLILVSQTNCPADDLLQLFDAFISDMASFEDIIASLQVQPRRGKKPAEIETAIAGIMEKASTFQSSHGYDGWTFEDYRRRYKTGQNPLGESQATAVQNIIIGELSMSKDHIQIHNVTGPVNIKSHLHKVVQTVTNSPNVPQGLQEEFSSLVSRLQEALDKVTSASPDDSNRILQSMDMVAAEITKSKPNKAFLKISLEGLKEAASSIKTITPIVIEVAESIFAFVNRHYLQT